MQVLALQKDHFITFPNVYIKVAESNDKKSTPTPVAYKKSYSNSWTSNDTSKKKKKKKKKKKLFECKGICFVTK